VVVDGESPVRYGTVLVAAAATATRLGKGNGRMWLSVGVCVYWSSTYTREQDSNRVIRVSLTLLCTGPV